jgi:hypothetical protein
MGEKLRRTEQILEAVRKNLAKEMLISKTLATENEELQHHCNELEARNDILMASYKLYE